MKKLFLTLSISLGLSFLIPSLASAHPGGKDRYGCHTNRSTGNYHCHNSGNNNPRSRPNSSPSNSNNINRPIQNENNLRSEDLCTTPLERGSKGYAVGNLQRLLIQLDYLPANALDGDFGSQTENAVKNLQVDYNLMVDTGKETTVDGIVGCYMKFILSGFREANCNGNNREHTACVSVSLLRVTRNLRHSGITFTKIERDKYCENIVPYHNGTAFSSDRMRCKIEWSKAKLEGRAPNFEW